MNLYNCQLRGKCLSSFGGGTAVACLLLAAASSAFAQHISVGIKAGVPLTDLVRTNWSSAFYSGGDVRTSTQTKRYTIGPVVDIGLVLGFGVEFGAMYKRFDQQSLGQDNQMTKAIEIVNAVQ